MTLFKLKKKSIPNSKKSDFFSQLSTPETTGADFDRTRQVKSGQNRDTPRQSGEWAPFEQMKNLMNFPTVSFKTPIF